MNKLKWKWKKNCSTRIAAGNTQYCIL